MSDPKLQIPFSYARLIRRMAQREISDLKKAVKSKSEYRVLRSDARMVQLREIDRTIRAQMVITANEIGGKKFGELTKFHPIRILGGCRE